MGFTQAEREQLKALIAMMGASGSGKTFSSLRLAKGMVMKMFPDLDPESQEFWNKIGVVDTEHKRSKVYANNTKHGVYIGKFQFLEIKPPFTHDKYVNAIKMAQNTEIEVLILDSTTHLWKELLEEQAKLGGRYQDWQKVTPKYEEFVNAVSYADMHVICTMRSKQEHALEESDTGKLKVRKLGMKPVQRDDFEYEFLTALLIDNENHMATATKDNTPVFEALGEFQVDEEQGMKLVEWLDLGVDPKEEERKRQEQAEKERAAQIEYIQQLCKDSTVISAMVTDFEEKAKMPLADMKAEWVTKAYKLVEYKVAELAKEQPQEQGA